MHDSAVSDPEATRLAALRNYGILDTLDEDAYDDITKLASFICGTPIALISLVAEDRQWFKSSVGLQVKETPREHAFCAHAILKSDEVMVVEDASVDGRFERNPLVTGEPSIRFYAGAPLVTPTGEAIGTLCVIDRESRSLSKNQAQAIRALARQVVAQLELRRVVIELQHLNKEQSTYRTVIEDLNAKLEAVSVTDSLTGLKNRRAFDSALKDQLAYSARSKSPLSLLLLDLDKFKNYNDSYGHVAGDEALRLVARALASDARPYDLVARYGGEELAIILPNTCAQDARFVGERARRAIEEIAWPNNTVTVSVGVATGVPGMSPTTLITLADQALYAVKRRGGNQVLHCEELLDLTPIGSTAKSNSNPPDQPIRAVAVGR